ncbi:MAG TPA: hypothetical protein VMV46_19645 [Thermoanaerobaculia bacterium]|nr:hypothetical protein [Thermoanaerobaculia bacterium]
MSRRLRIAAGPVAHGFLARLRRAWAPGRRGHLLGIATTVAVALTLAHRAAPRADPRLWLAVHAALPATVFGLGAWSAGARRPTLGGALRGAVVVAVVMTAFGWINGRSLPQLVALTLNFLVPLTVSTAGAVLARDPRPHSTPEEIDP